ncbi:MAG TPA: hypothetical protein VN397_02340 [Candidatus Methylomirabilis sp.]|nr:hypothetical protein [Candidatus Methylomirabilis sp.]
MLILLDPSCAFLGEVALESGVFVRVILTDRGEEMIGAAVREWQTRGVPVRRELFGTKGNPNDIVFYQERVHPRDRQFGEALAQWCGERRIAAVVLPSGVTECWNKVLRLPLEPQERLALLIALSKTDPAMISPWQDFLDEAICVCEAQTSDADAAIGKLRKKAAEGLVKRFARV